MANLLVRKIRKILVPFLGKFITDSTIRVNCQRIGENEDTISEERLLKFVGKIKITLLLFFEEEKVEDILHKIKDIKM